MTKVQPVTRTLDLLTVRLARIAWVTRRMLAGELGTTWLRLALQQDAASMLVMKSTAPTHAHGQRCAVTVEWDLRPLPMQG
jgi:hypothetical protein